MQETGPIGEPSDERLKRILDLEDDVSLLQHTQSLPTIRVDRRLAGILRSIAEVQVILAQALPADQQARFHRSLEERLRQRVAECQDVDDRDSGSIAFAEGSAGWIAAMLLVTKTDVAADLSDDVIPERIRRLLNPSP